ncbi:conserved hypothetical protein [Mesorhizobium sp. SOD10]|nr:conserved hypothetical protein [Mesorhizobium sp. SOD10]
MVHIIPLFVGERRLDTGNPVQYPDSSPVGEAMQQFGDRWQAAAERYEQRKAQQQAFDTEIAARRLNGELAQAEAETVANAPADGAGLHDTMYGQVDPYTGQVVKTGLFDTLFGNFLKQLPPELRDGLAARKEALRAVGGRRMAAQQNQRRKQYEQDQVAEAHTAELSNIAQSDPNDTAAFDASRQAGLDLIAKMDLDPRAKALAEADWLDRSAKTRIEALIAKNPQVALNLLGLKSSHENNLSGQGVDGMTTGSIRQADSAVVSGEKEDRLRKVDPSERVGQAFQDNVPIDVLRAQLSPESYGDLVRQARSADAASSSPCILASTPTRRGQRPP